MGSCGHTAGRGASASSPPASNATGSPLSSARRETKSRPARISSAVVSASVVFAEVSASDSAALSFCPPEQPATIKGTYLENYKNIWDLYITDTATTGAALLSATGDQAEAEFGEGKAAFYQNGTWEYSNLTSADKFGMNPDDLTMIPIYCGVEGEEKAGLCCGTENCWAINKNASPEDIQATLDFMYWVVTSEEGTAMLADQFGPCPFKNAKTPENVFFAAANEYVANGNYTVTWAFNWTPAVDDWRAAVVDALSQYTTGTGDWSTVETAFVQGWATQYANEH